MSTVDSAIQCNLLDAPPLAMTTSPEEPIAEYLLESTESESASETDEDYFEIEESSDFKRYLHKN